MTHEQIERAYHRGFYHGVTAAGDVVEDGGGLKEIEKLDRIVMQLRREQWDSGPFRDEARRRMLTQQEWIQKRKEKNHGNGFVQTD